MNPRVRILLAEDHPQVRLQLKFLLEKEADLEVIGEAPDGLVAVELASRFKPDLLVTDLIMPGLHGLSVLRRVIHSDSHVCVIVVSAHLDEPYVALALRSGAVGYVDKNGCHDFLVAAVRAALAGRRYLSPPLDQALLTANPAIREAERDFARFVTDAALDDEKGTRLGPSRTASMPFPFSSV